MGHFEQSIIIAAPVDVVFHFHDDAKNLLRITPPELRTSIISTEGKPGRGHRVRLRMWQLGILPVTVLVEFVEYDPPRRLVDVQIEGPFRLWRQTRLFEPVPGGTRLTDSVEYELPFGLLGRIADRLVVAVQIRKMFSYRQNRTRALLTQTE
jgi:ligand-binding SRPBCC domain-containing protein